MNIILFLLIACVFALLCALIVPALRTSPRTIPQRQHGTWRPFWRRMFRARRPGSFALANANTFPGALGLMTEDGKISGFVDAGVSLPVSQRWLIWKYGADANHFAIAGAADYPLGPSPDSPSGTIVSTALQMSVYVLGCKKGSLIGISAGAITHGNPVGTAANGQIQDLTLAGNGNYWLIGYALSDVTVANAECAYAPQSPRLVTITANAISAVVK